MERLKYLRKIYNVTQEDLAQYLGVKRNTISDWESGNSEPNIENIILIADYFNVTIDYLLNNKTNNRISNPLCLKIMFKANNFNLEQQKKLINILDNIISFKWGNMELGSNLKQLRKENNLTQEQLAILINVKRHNIVDWETGRSEPSINHLKALSRIFSTSINNLLGQTQKLSPNLRINEQYEYLDIPVNQELLALINKMDDNQLVKINQLIDYLTSF